MKLGRTAKCQMEMTDAKTVSKIRSFQPVPQSQISPLAHSLQSPSLAYHVPRPSPACLDKCQRVPNPRPKHITHQVRQAPPEMPRSAVGRAGWAPIEVPWHGSMSHGGLGVWILQRPGHSLLTSSSDFLAPRMLRRSSRSPSPERRNESRIILSDAGAGG